MQNAECRMQNAECRMQNAECRMMNAEAEGRMRLGFGLGGQTHVAAGGGFVVSG